MSVPVRIVDFFLLISYCIGGLKKMENLVDYMFRHVSDVTGGL